MNFSLFAARRLVLGKKSFSSLIIRLGIIAVAVSLAVMIVATCIMVGYKKEITARITGFSSHIIISALDFNESFEAQPISSNPAFMADVKEVPGVKHMQEFAHKAGIIKTADAIQGLVIKGVGPDFDWSFLETVMVEGQRLLPGDTSASDQIMISKYTADKLQLKVGQKINIFFLQDQSQPVRVRRPMICGIFETGLEDYDKTYGIMDIRHIRKLYNWPDTFCEGFEVKLNDFESLDVATNQVRMAVGPMLRVLNAKEIKPQIFDWLRLLDLNVIIILCLMIVVAIINMSTALLILIFERTNMIGMLKALGASNRQVRNIFLWKAGYLILQGLFWGNLVALGLGYLQNSTGLMKLNPENYYLSQVPFDMHLPYILLINLGSFILCLFVLLLPSAMIASISPVKALRFE